MKEIIDFFQNKDPQQIYFYLLIIFFLVLLIFNISFKNKFPTCNHYIVNVYLYFGLGITLIGFFTYLFEYLNVQFSTTIMIISFVLTLLLIFLSFYIYTQKNIFANHIIWLALLVGFSISIYPMVSSPIYKPYINRTIMNVSIIFLLMSIVAYSFPQFFESTYKTMMTVLVITLMAIIIVEVIMIIYGSLHKNRTYTGRSKIMNYIIIILFMLFISYDTTLIRMKARTCKETSIYEYPNYPIESLGIILDVLNLFVSMLQNN